MKIKVCVMLEDGDYFYTTFNGTYGDADRYYIGKVFNMGTVKDNMQKCIGVYFLN